MTEELRDERQQMNHYVNSKSPQRPDASYLEVLSQPPTSIMRLSVSTKQSTLAAVSSDWIVCNRMGMYGEVHRMALEESKAAQGLKLIPWAGCATLMPSEPAQVIGKIFCFLPLPTQTELPVHVNGCFELNTNRRGKQSYYREVS